MLFKKNVKKTKSDHDKNVEKKYLKFIKYCL